MVTTTTTKPKAGHRSPFKIRRKNARRNVKKWGKHNMHRILRKRELNVRSKQSRDWKKNGLIIRHSRTRLNFAVSVYPLHIRFFEWFVNAHIKMATVLQLPLRTQPWVMNPAAYMDFKSCRTCLQSQKKLTSRGLSFCVMCFVMKMSDNFEDTVPMSVRKAKPT